MADCYYVYVLRSLSSGKFYTGHTQDLNARINQHNTGESRYTRGRGPWTLVYAEEVETRSKAMIRERFLKTGKGRQFIQAQIEKLL